LVVSGELLADSLGAGLLSFEPGVADAEAVVSGA